MLKETENVMYMASVAITQLYHCSSKAVILLDFPGGPVVKSPCFHGRGHGFHPWLGKFHMPCNVAKKQPYLKNKKIGVLGSNKTLLTKTGTEPELIHGLQVSNPELKQKSHMII